MFARDNCKKLCLQHETGDKGIEPVPSARMDCNFVSEIIMDIRIN